METVKQSLIMLLLAGFGFSCASPREVCYDRLEENDGESCERFLLGYLALKESGRDPSGLQGLALAFCLRAEEGRKKCQKEPNIPWIGI